MPRVRRRAWLLWLIAPALAGCRLERGPNIAGVAGVWVGHARASTDAGTVGGVAAHLSAAEVGDDRAPFIASSTATLAIGGNSVAPAGIFELGGELGWAPKITENQHVFMRGGLLGTVQIDPYTSYLAFEFPTATVGYVFHPHGDGPLEASHFEFGAHGGLVAASRGEVDGLRMDRVAAAEIGPLLDFRTTLFSTKVGWQAIFLDRTVHQIRSSTCVGGIAVVCVESRHMTFPDLDLGFRGYVGVTIGLGWVAGLFPR